MALKNLALRWEALSTGVAVPVTYTFVRHYLLTCCSQHSTLVHTLLHLCCAGVPAHVSHTPVLPTGYMTAGLIDSPLLRRQSCLPIEEDFQQGYVVC